MLVSPCNITKLMIYDYGFSKSKSLYLYLMNVHKSETAIKTQRAKVAHINVENIKLGLV